MKSMHKKGMNLGGISFEKIMYLVIGAVILFTAVPLLLVELNTGLGTMQVSGLPLATLFKQNGVIILAVMGVIAMGVFGAVFAWRGRK